MATSAGCSPARQRRINDVATRSVGLQPLHGQWPQRRQTPTTSKLVDTIRPGATLARRRLCHVGEYVDETEWVCAEMWQNYGGNKRDAYPERCAMKRAQHKLSQSPFPSASFRRPGGGGATSGMRECPTTSLASRSHTQAVPSTLPCAQQPSNIETNYLMPGPWRLGEAMETDLRKSSHTLHARALIMSSLRARPVCIIAADD